MQSRLDLLLYVCGLLNGIYCIVAMEFCQDEEFVAECDNHQVIHMQQAELGRMRAGRCLDGQYPMGCVGDVLPYVQRKCAGLSRCNFDVYKLRKMATTCSRDFTVYLNTSYICVGEIFDGECDNISEAKKLYNNSGYVTSNTLFKQGFGSSNCPWRVSAIPGQHITLSVFDISLDGTLPARFDSADPWARCALVLQIEDNRNVTTISLCNQSPGLHRLYVSRNSVITFHVWINESFRSELSDQDLPRFFLHYEVSGCPNKAPPINAWAHRDGESLMIQCNKTGETWYLVCKGMEWFGEVGNCSTEEFDDKHQKEDEESETAFPYNILLAVTIGVGIGVVVGLVLLGFVYACIKCRENYSQSATSARATQNLSTIEVPYKADRHQAVKEGNTRVPANPKLGQRPALQSTSAYDRCRPPQPLADQGNTAAKTRVSGSFGLSKKPVQCSDERLRAATPSSSFERLQGQHEEHIYETAPCDENAENKSTARSEQYKVDLPPPPPQIAGIHRKF